MSRARRLVARILVSCLIAAASCLAFAGPSHALVNLVACQGTSTVTYSPGLTNATQPVTISGTINFGLCLSISHPLITWGTVSGGSGGPVPVSCAILEATSSGTSTLNWADGSSTTYDYTTAINPGLNGEQVVTITGAVTGGLFLGGRVVIQADFLFVNGSCETTTGLTSRSGPTTLLITSL